ncbi:NTPase [Methanobacterium alcaliphilum]|uniref:NTPase n=1 Tax=Methanobacterium alcaliphilum TaxID=392018 RepID=UPI00200A81A2|nr:NTPase [Methanobacterium alcaliphilum]MCK9150462.1 NTPase [Methanobacterium alcaliphilum]
MTNKRVLITGSPGVGKTTLLYRIRDSLTEKNLLIGGVFCPEIITHGQRSGFAIINIMTGQKGLLSCKDCEGPKVGSYGVSLENLKNIGAKALEMALGRADYILIDEIGPMELKSPEFFRAIEKVFDSSKNVIAVIHKKSNNPVVLNIKNREDVVLFDINLENSGLVYGEIVRLLDL